MDLHAWIAQRVDAVEADARASLIDHSVVLVLDDDRGSISGTITDVEQATDGVQFTVAQHGAAAIGIAPVNAATAVLRRCDADRRILARHTLNTDDCFESACQGCDIDSWGLPNTENLNDCPELRDLAHAHGLTEEQAAQLDRPQAPERPVRTRDRLGLVDILAPRIQTPMRDVPEALRGRHWQAHN